MNQYNIIYYDNSTDIILAYGYTTNGSSVTFDLGRGRKLHLSDVKYVQLLAGVESE